MKIFLSIILFLLLLSLLNVKFYFKFGNGTNEFEIKFLCFKIYPRAKKEGSDTQEEKTEKKSESVQSKPENDKTLETENKDKIKKSTSKKENVKAKHNKKVKNEKDISEDSENEGFVKTLLKNPEDTIYVLKKVLIDLKRLFQWIYVRNFVLEADICGKDAKDTAENYYKFCSLALSTIGFFSSLLNFKNKNTKINPDFCGKKNKINLSFLVKARICVLVVILVRLAYALVILYIKLSRGKHFKNKISKKESTMAESGKIDGLMGLTLDKIKQIADVKTIIGDPVKIDDNITVIPVSKVSYGAGSGGSDLPVKGNNGYFGGGAGAGMTVTPVGFLVVQDGNVRILQLKDENKATVADAVPGIIDTVSSFISKKKNNKSDDEIIDEAKKAAKSEKKSKKAQKTEKEGKN